MVAISFGLGSMFCAGINDFVFKKYAARGNSVGAYLALIGLVWALFFFLVGRLDMAALAEPATLRWGLISGFFGIAANILLVIGMARLDVGMAATIYRLNLAPAAILAFVFLGESATGCKLLGVAAGVLAVVLFCSSSVAQENGGCRGAWWVVLACLLRAGMGVSYKWGLSCGAGPYGLLAINGMVWLVCGALFHCCCRGDEAATTHSTWRYGLVSGGLCCGIVLFMMLGLQRGDASIVLPIAQLSFIATSLLGALFLREKLSRRKLAGISVAFVCVVLLTLGAK